LPAWYGLGAAYRSVVETNPDAKSLLAAAYVEWPFLQSTVDNASLALAKANMSVFRRYCRLADDVPDVEQLVELVLNEYQLACQAAIEISGSEELLGNVPWLRRSIQVRNGYVDPLNLMQVELIERTRGALTYGASVAPGQLDYLLSLSVKGVAAGMRTTG
jgi:phosphoenolpyruvate carboxylase